MWQIYKGKITSLLWFSTPSPSFITTSFHFNNSKPCKRIFLPFFTWIHNCEKTLDSLSNGTACRHASGRKYADIQYAFFSPLFWKCSVESKQISCSISETSLTHIQYMCLLYSSPAVISMPFNPQVKMQVCSYTPPWSPVTCPRIRCSDLQSV